MNGRKSSLAQPNSMAQRAIISVLVGFDSVRHNASEVNQIALQYLTLLWDVVIVDEQPMAHAKTLQKS